jgi:hypothetical protein
MIRIFSILLLLAAGLACASRSGYVPGADAAGEFGGPPSFPADSSWDPKAVLSRYTVNFKIPNPLVDGGISTRVSDPSHEDRIYCRATLLDSVSTEADIALACRKDSLDAAAAVDFRRKYIEERTQPGRFRIRIEMESGFSPKSLDPVNWVMYLVNSRGVMIEPAQVLSSLSGAVQDSVYSSFNRAVLPRTRIRGEIVLFFDRVTFFKEDLLGEESPFIALEMAHNKETVARVAWKNAGTPKP